MSNSTKVFLKTFLHYFCFIVCCYLCYTIGEKQYFRDHVSKRALQGCEMVAHDINSLLEETEGQLKECIQIADYCCAKALILNKNR